MKYKPGDKFIIEIDRCFENCAPPNYGIKNCTFALFNETHLRNLEPYSKSAEYQRGLDDAWEAARKISCEDGLSFEELTTVFETYSILNILRDNTAAEAIAKIRAYEEEQKIKVGDEVEIGDVKFVVTMFGDSQYYGISKEGHFVIADNGFGKKTGRHFPETASLVEKLFDSYKEDAPNV